MRSFRLFVLFAALASLGAISVYAQPATRGGSHPETANGGAFLHKARSIGDNINVSGHMTRLESEFPLSDASPMTDGNPNAVIFATNNVTFSTGNQWTPFGVYMELMEDDGTWYLFNQQTSVDMANGTAFNIQVQGKSDTVFVHTAKTGNIGFQNHITRIDHPLLNGNPDAIISVTQLWKGVYNNHHVGVYYEAATTRWTIFNQDLAAMPLGAKFNVQVLTDPDTYDQHTANVGNTFNTSETELDHPLLNDNIGAQFIVTQRWTGTYNDNPIGVVYSNISSKWRIVNTDGSAMPDGASFNIHITHNGDHYNDGLVVNGGFEAPAAEGLNGAAHWNSINAGAGSKRVCNKQAPVSTKTKVFSNTGDCAFQLKGAVGETRKLVTTVLADPTVPQNAVELLAWMKKKGDGALTVKAKVTLDDGTKLSVGLPSVEVNGVYDWKLVGNWQFLPPDTSVVKVKLKFKLTGAGKVYIDDVSSAAYLGAIR